MAVVFVERLRGESTRFDRVRRADATSMTPELDRSLGGSSNHGDLDEQTGNEVRSHCRPYRLHSCELLLVDGVERGEVSQVNEVNKARNDVVERCSGSLEHGFDVVEGLLGLFGQIVTDHLA